MIQGNSYLIHDKGQELRRCFCLESSPANLMVGLVNVPVEE